MRKTHLAGAHLSEFICYSEDGGSALGGGRAPWDDEPLSPPTLKLLDVSAGKVDRVTAESGQILPGRGVGDVSPASGGHRNNKTTGWGGAEEAPLVGVLALNPT